MQETINKKAIPTYKLFKGAAEWPLRDILHHELIQARVEDHHGEIETHRHHDLFHVFYLSKGKARSILDGHESTIEAPLLVTVPPLCVHGITPIGEVQGHLLTLPGSSMNHLMSNAESDTNFAELPCIIENETKENFSYIDNLLGEIANEYHNKANSSFLAIQSLMRLILVWIIRRNLEDKASVNAVKDRDTIRIRRFKKIIESNFTRSLTVKDYASEIGLSAGQLNNICRAKVGKTALQIIHERMVLEIKRNLAYTSLTISEIAYKLGFNDPAYFTRFFNKQTGLSPKQYRSEAKPNDLELIDLNK